MRLPALTASLMLAAALPAHAVYTTVEYGGTVSKVIAATSGPEGPTDIVVGTHVTFSAKFDLSKAVDRSATFFNIDNLTGLPVPVPNLKTVSIFDDPLASYTVTVGSHVFTSADDDEGGRTFGLGAGRFPLVVYNGSQLLGIDGEADVGGLVLGLDPLAYMLQYSRAVGNGFYDVDGDYGFRVTTDLDGAIDATRLAAAVPEPGTWALMLAGLAVISGAARRGRQAASAGRSLAD